MKRAYIVLLAIAVLVLGGCLQTETVIKLKKDGSGTIEQTVLMNTEMLKQMVSSMAQEMGGEAPAEDEPLELVTEEELRAGASELGEGVEYVSMENIDNGAFTGYKAVYSFKDVTKLQLNQNPGENVPSGEAGEEKNKEIITFKFKKGSGKKAARLTIIMPEDLGEEIEKKAAQKSDDKGDEEEAELTPEQQAQAEQQEQMAKMMMQQMLGGMRVSMSIEFEGEIVKTNASFVEGGRVTLMDMDFDKLLANEEAFDEFASSNPETLGSAKEIMKNVPGMKVELENKVTVRFK